MGVRRDMESDLCKMHANRQRIAMGLDDVGSLAFSGANRVEEDSGRGAPLILRSRRARSAPGLCQLEDATMRSKPASVEDGCDLLVTDF